MFSVERVVFEKEDFKKIGIKKEVRYVGHFSTSNLYGWGSFEYSLYEFVEEPYYLVLENCSDNNDFDDYNIRNYNISKISENFGTKITLKLRYYANKLYDNSQKGKSIIYRPEFLDKESGKNVKNIKKDKTIKIRKD